MLLDCVLPEGPKVKTSGKMCVRLGRAAANQSPHSLPVCLRHAACKAGAQCKTCADASHCTTCNGADVLSPDATACVAMGTYGDGYYIETGNSVSQYKACKAGAQCKTCADASHCTACSGADVLNLDATACVAIGTYGEGYYVESSTSGGVPQYKACHASCRTCSSFTSCLKCPAGQVVATTGFCASSCGVGEYLESSTNGQFCRGT